MLPPGHRRTVGPSKRSSVRPSIRPTDQPSTLLSLSATNHPVHDGWLILIWFNLKYFLKYLHANMEHKTKLRNLFPTLDSLSWAWKCTYEFYQICFSDFVRYQATIFQQFVFLKHWKYLILFFKKLVSSVKRPAFVIYRCVLKKAVDRLDWKKKIHPSCSSQPSSYYSNSVLTAPLSGKWAHI